MRLASRLAIALLLAVSPMPSVVAGEHAHEVSAGAITIVHPWARAAQAGGSTLVFFEIENAGATDRLLGAETGAAQSVEIVGLGLDNGAVSHKTVGAIDIETGDFDFDPKGLGLFLDTLNQDLVAGGVFELELTFAEAGPVHVHVQIEAADARQHSHAGHSH